MKIANNVIRILVVAELVVLAWALTGCAVQPPVVDVFMHPGDSSSTYNH
jgi:hypothetical protein